MTTPVSAEELNKWLEWQNDHRMWNLARDLNIRRSDCKVLVWMLSQENSDPKSNTYRHEHVLTEKALDAFANYAFAEVKKIAVKICETQHKRTKISKDCMREMQERLCAIDTLYKDVAEYRVCIFKRVKAAESAEAAFWKEVGGKPVPSLGAFATGWTPQWHDDRVEHNARLNLKLQEMRAAGDSRVVFHDSVYYP